MTANTSYNSRAHDVRAYSNARRSVSSSVTSSATVMASNDSVLATVTLYPSRMQWR